MQTRPATTTNDDLIERATKAYYERPEAGLDQLAPAMSEVFVRQNTKYVLLANSYRTLAIYKVNTDGSLEGLLASDWPKGFE